MQATSPKPDEAEINRALERSADLESLSANLHQLHQSNRVSVCDFLLFLLVNELYSDQHALAFKALLLRLAHDAHLTKYVHFLWVLEKQKADGVGKLLFTHFLKDPRLSDLLSLKLEELRGYLEKVYGGRKAADAVPLVDAALAQLPLTGGEPPVSGVFVLRGEAAQYERVADGAREAEEVLQRAKAFSLSNNTNLVLELAVPMPEELVITEDDLMTPFPFVLDEPLVNPCLRYNLLVKELLRALPKLGEEELSVR